MKMIVPTLLASAAVLAGCASGPPPTANFPPGARAPAAAEITSLLRGKSFSMNSPTAGTIRSDYAAEANSVTAYFGGRSDSGTWRTEDGRVCYEFKTIPSACNDLRMVGADLYFKRSNGEVVKVLPR